MSALNKKMEDPVEETPAALVVSQPVEKKKSKVNKANKTFFEIIGGKMLSKDGFVKMLCFILYIVLLLMLYITNVYVAEDINRDIYKQNRISEELRVEYVFLKSEITKITKQSNLVRMLKNKGIKESVEPLRVIVVKEEGGDDE